MNIRASMLAGYSDCVRRTVAKSYGRKLEKLGYQLRQLPPSVGAAAGTAVHAATAEMDRALWNGSTINVDAAVELAMKGFYEETAPGCIWDATTPNAHVAEFQIKRMTKIYKPRMPFTMPDGTPAVEIGGKLGLRANAGDGWFLTGHPDLIDVDRFVRDKKTGSVERPYHKQLGGYSLLVRSNKIIEPVGVGMDYIPRVGKTREQPVPIITEYPAAVCERAAMGTIHQIKHDMFLFDSLLEDVAGDICKVELERAFPSNQMSMMCTDKYCPAWGTSFCELTCKR